MELGRRLAAGELAAIFGPAALESDLETRRYRMRRIAEARARLMPDSDRRAFVAYARGVNHFIGTHQGRFPVEFAVLGTDPAPWTIVDSVLLGLQMYRAMTDTWKDEILKKNLLAGGESDKVEALFPQRSATETLLGSNAWVVSGKHTRSGKPLLSNDPHLAYSLPSVWYQVHLRAGEFDVAGVALPGLPGVGIGHNRHIAWGITSLQFDEQDLYREKLNPSNLVYQYQGRLEQAAREQEFVRVRGGRTAEAQVTVTRHGPVILVEGDQVYAMRWTAADQDTFAYPMIELNHARNWDEFRRALSRFGGPAFNFLYADTQGNIGYQAAGRLPLRKAATGDIPRDGSTGEFEWLGFIPFEKLPSQLNPASGIVVTANQDPFPKDYQYPVNAHFYPDHRARQIRDLLKSRNGWDTSGMAQVQKDLYSNLAHSLARLIVAACQTRRVTNPGLTEAIDLLKNWNGQMEPDSAAALVVTLAFQHMRKAMVDRAAPGKGALYEIVQGQGALDRLLSQRPPDWFPDYDQFLVRSLLDGVEEGNRLQGSNVRKWRYGAYNSIELRNPVLGRIPWIGKYFGLGPQWMGGAASTVRVSSRRAGQSMRFIADLADLDNSRIVIVTGQSGQALSGHYRDQWKTWLGGGNFRMQFDKIETAAALDLVPK